MGDRPSLGGAKRAAPDALQGVNKMQRLGSGSGELVKGAWSADEDELMKEAVEKHGTDWKKVAEMVVGRTSKQCRDRYKLKLDPSINHGPWSPDEDDQLAKLQEQLGNQWTKIAKQMPGRTENSVKSRFASLERSRNREWNDEEDMILRNCRKEDLDFQHISDRYLTKRSEHAIRKRWEKLYMRDLAKQIREELPSNKTKVSATIKEEGSDSLPPLSMSTPSTSSHPNFLSNLTMTPPPTSLPQSFESSGLTLPASLLPPALSNSTFPTNMSNLNSNSTGGSSSISSAINDLLSGGTSATATPPMSSSFTFGAIPSLVPNVKTDVYGSNSLFGTDESTDFGNSRISNRSGNIKRQSTSVTVLQQILGEPLKNL